MERPELVNQYHMVRCDQTTRTGIHCKNRGRFQNIVDGCNYCGQHANSLTSRYTKSLNQRNQLLVETTTVQLCGQITKAGRACQNRGKHDQGNGVFRCGKHNTTKINSAASETVVVSDCSICICPLDSKVSAGDSKVFKTSPCKHTFHQGCIKRWVETGKRSCPLCRAQLKRLGQLGTLEHHHHEQVHLQESNVPPIRMTSDGTVAATAVVSVEHDHLAYRPFEPDYPLDIVEASLSPTEYWDFIRYSLGMIVPTVDQRIEFEYLMSISTNLSRIYGFYNELFGSIIQDS